MVDAVVLEGKRADQSRLRLICNQNAADQVGATATRLLRHGQKGHDAVGGMAAVEREIAVVEVEFADRRGIGEGGPGAIGALVGGQADQPRSGCAGKAQRLSAGHRHGRAI